MTEAYSPSRGLVSKLKRRATQWRMARPANLRFGEPILSITFDDFPASAANDGARILEAHGARGTYYASSGLADTHGPCGRHFSPVDLRRLAVNGHEIGCHTTHHADCGQREALDTLHDLAANRDALCAMGAPSPRSHAYPYGEATFALKQTLPPRFMCARGILPGLNIGRTDLAQLRAYPMFGANAWENLHAAMQLAAKRRAWLVTFTHDVSDHPSPWGTTGEELDLILRTAHSLGFTILPVSAALTRRLA